jgi:hypothetical protein
MRLLHGRACSPAVAASSGHGAMFGVPPSACPALRGEGRREERRPGVRPGSDPRRSTAGGRRCERGAALPRPGTGRGRRGPRHLTRRRCCRPGGLHPRPRRGRRGGGLRPGERSRALEVERELFRALDEAARPDVVLASSSSGLLPTAIQADCAPHPERVLVGHPFSPPHRSRSWRSSAARRPRPMRSPAVDSYRSVGEKPIVLRRELPGHVADRLQAALWKEAYFLVERGVADTLGRASPTNCPPRTPMPWSPGAAAPEYRACRRSSRTTGGPTGCTRRWRSSGCPRCSTPDSPASGRDCRAGGGSSCGTPTRC